MNGRLLFFLDLPLLPAPSSRPLVAFFEQASPRASRSPQLAAPGSAGRAGPVLRQSSRGGARARAARAARTAEAATSHEDQHARRLPRASRFPYASPPTPPPTHHPPLPTEEGWRSVANRGPVCRSPQSLTPLAHTLPRDTPENPLLRCCQLLPSRRWWWRPTARRTAAPTSTAASTAVRHPTHRLAPSLPVTQ